MSLLATSNPSNFSNGTTNADPCNYRSPLIYTVIPVYIMIISVLGILLNVFVLLVFSLHKKACTVAEIYLSNLAAADLLLTIFLPFWAQNTANHYDWPFSDFLCKAVNAAIVMNACSSIYFIVIISIDRYLALVHPITHESMRRPRNAKLVCTAVWGLALVFTCPTIIYREVTIFPGTKTCWFNVPHQVAYDTLMIILTFIIPISLILFFTVKICSALRNRLLTKMKRSLQVQEQKATVLIIAVVLAFLVCWVPHHVIKVIGLLVQLKVVGGCTYELNLSLARNIFVYFAYFNSVLNPFLYVSVGKNFQKKVKELFTLQCDNRNRMSFSLVSSRLSRSGHTDIVPV